jgi:acetyl esterase/lipase
MALAFRRGDFVQMDRRSLIGLGALALAAMQTRASAQTPTRVPPDPDERIELWPGVAPGLLNPKLAPRIVETSPEPDIYRNRQLTGIAQPALAVFRPAAPDGSAVVILPGGGYRALDFDVEGYDVARVLNAVGVVAFVLTYRLPHEGWQDAADVPLQDAQRAMRLIRAGAAKYAVDPARLGVLGFSAGGHVAASLATRSTAKVYPPLDDADMQSAAPAFAAVLYPVITMLPPFAHEASREQLLGDHPSTDMRAAYSCERLVTRETPPCFLAAAVDDPDVPVDNSLAMLAGLRAAHVPAELHLFEKGGHGFGLGVGQPAGAWPDLFIRWAQARGVFRGTVL